ncbi:MAG TPA: Gfo/Idh/MocA family oxidoreductase, partial [Aggregatilineales bacterium]|nr:Gfo/Idh/MocA family oxidoreductase [Aggregatilineales bacterium]
MIRFGVVGTGWRSRFFLRIAHSCPDIFEAVGVVTRDIDRASEWIKPYDVPLFSSLDDLLAQKPLFVVTSVPGHVNPGLLKALAEKGVPA